MRQDDVNFTNALDFASKGRLTGDDIKLFRRRKYAEIFEEAMRENAGFLCLPFFFFFCKKGRWGGEEQYNITVC
jgi:hypothetical protein